MHVLLPMQVMVKVDERPSCAECRIVTEVFRDLRSNGGTIPLSRHSYVVQSPRGSFYVSDPWDAQPVFVYGFDGRFERSIGRKGLGPGELPFVSAIAVDRDDTVHTFGTHYTVFGPTGRFARSRQVFGGARVSSAHVLPDGKLLVQAMPSTADLIGLPFHVLERRATALRSFGELPNERVRYNFWTRWRPIAFAPPDHLWAARVNQYRMELWSTSRGQLVTVLERDARWFPPWTNHSGEIDVDEPPPRLLSMRVDAQGLLWVLTMVADANYKPIAQRIPGRERPVWTVADEARLNDTIIEVIDPTTGRLIASRRFPQALSRFVGSDLVLETIVDDEQDVALRLWSIRLLR